MKGKGLKSKDKTGRYYQFGALAVAILMISGMAIGTLVITENGTYDTDMDNQYVNNLESDYVIWKDGSNYYAKNGTNGVINKDTNFTKIIQDCINELNESGDGGLINIKKGVYSVTFPIYVKRNIHIKGAGYSWPSSNDKGITILRLANSANCTVIYLQGTIGVDNFHLEDFLIDGNQGNQDGGGYGIYADSYFKDGLIEHVNIEDCPQDGMYFDGTSWGLVIDTCIIEHNGGDGLHVDSWAKVFGCKINSNTGYGVYVDGGGCIFTNNEIGDNGKNGIFIGGGSIFTGNNLYGNDNSGSYFGQMFTSVGGSTIVGNRIDCNGDSRYGLHFWSTSQNNTVGDNIITEGTHGRILDQGKMNIINNVGKNAGNPNSEGVFYSTGVGELGDIVFDTINDKYYSHNGTAWMILN